MKKFLEEVVFNIICGLPIAIGTALIAFGFVMVMG